MARRSVQRAKCKKDRQFDRRPTFHSKSCSASLYRQSIPSRRACFHSCLARGCDAMHRRSRQNTLYEFTALRQQIRTESDRVSATRLAFNADRSLSFSELLPAPQSYVNQGEAMLVMPSTQALDSCSLLQIELIAMAENQSVPFTFSCGSRSSPAHARPPAIP